MGLFSEQICYVKYGSEDASTTNATMYMGCLIQ